MIRRVWVAILLFLLCASAAEAHIGSPDVFYKGQAGPYPVAITIRMPGVVPGRATITVFVHTDEPVTVSFAPIASQTAASNAPPAETAEAMKGANNFFSGELWLMTEGAYSIDVRIRGASGEGSVRIPVNSVATRQLPLPAWLGGVLLGFGFLLFCGGVAIVAAAAGESTVAPETSPGNIMRRKYWKAAATSTFIFAVLLFGGKKWWDSEETGFRSRLREGGWPPMAASIRQKGSQRILHLYLGEPEWDQSRLSLALDHGKFLHLFLMREPDYGAFAHLHPVPTDEANTFEAPLPPLPEGDYKVLCDLTLAQSGSSSTATNTVHISPLAADTVASIPMIADPDDSWASESSVAVREKTGGDTVCRLPGGVQVIWKAHSALSAQHDAGLRFEVKDDAGRPAVLQPYMGMMSHAAILRSDGGVFSHIHPSGNFSMAAQVFFDKKMGNENQNGHLIGGEVVCGAGDNALSVITLPYEFPTAGNYRLWVQIKTGGQIKTAIFDTTVM